MSIEDNEPTQPPDAGEPQGASDPDRPPMLGRRFRLTLALGMLAGIAFALLAHYILTRLWYERTGGAGSSSHSAEGRRWLVSSFIYGAATDPRTPGQSRTAARTSASAANGDGRSTAVAPGVAQRALAEHSRARSAE